MLKKLLCTACIGAALTGLTCAAALGTTILELPVSPSTLSYHTDEQGNVFGPQDYFVTDGTVYLLDSAQNRILTYRNHKLTKTIPISDFTAIDIAGDSHTLCAIDNRFNLYRYDGSIFAKAASITPKFDEQLSNFQISNGFGYFYMPEGDHGTTYQFKLPEQYTSELPFTQTFDGYRLDDDTFYYKDSNDSEELFSSTCELVVYHPSSGQTQRIPVSSSSYLGQVQYLGETTDGHPMIYMEEITQDEDYKIKTTQSVRVLNDIGYTLSTYELPKQTLYAASAFASFDGQVYALSNLTNTVRVQLLSDITARSAAPALSIADLAHLLLQLHGLPV